MNYIKDTGYSQVWEEDGYIFKRQPSYLMANEIHALTLMVPDGWVPEFKRVELELLRMQKLVNVPLTDPVKFQYRCLLLLRALKDNHLRHGDLTRPHLFVTENNWPMLIDFGESRVMCDPRISKRPEGDEFWMERTVREILNDKNMSQVQ